MRIAGLLIVVCMLLVACGSRNTLAPVVEAWRSQPTFATEHTVRQGDTLYAIAWRYELDYRDLATLNHLPSPYHLTIGQVLQIAKPKHPPKIVKTKAQLPRQISKKKTAKKKTLTKKQTPKKKVLSQNKLKPVKPPPKKTHVYKTVKHWQRPAKGKIIQQFSLPQGHKGINIAGHRGDPVRAAAAGKVVYAGDGLRGYGHLVIIKHNAEFLSAYADNQRLLVKEGSWVKAGQLIAKMGDGATKHALLHFEIRKKGKPVNPTRYTH